MIFVADDSPTHFRVASAARRRELWSSAAERLRALVHPAIDVLEKQLTDTYEPTRICAAGVLLRLTDLRKAIAPKSEE
jgi:hypothetical protein